MNGTDEKKYIRKRLISAWFQSMPFYLFRIFKIKKRKIVFTTIEGTTGFTCNPKYIALELISRNAAKKQEPWELVWLVNNTGKEFPSEIKKAKNSLINRAYHLTTAHFWIDNSRKQLEARKREGQVYIQTWHAKLGFKPTCLDRGESFSKIAYLVSKHDSDMVDYWLSNSDWYDKTLKTGSLYEGKTIRSGSPRCDVLLTGQKQAKKLVRERFGLPEDARIIMYAPTFRGGSQGTKRNIKTEDHFPDYRGLKNSLEERFGGIWYIMLRLHPQLSARNIRVDIADDTEKFMIDGSSIDDMYELLAGCDAFLTDYSSAAFDAAVMKIPVFLYCEDYSDYENERGKLLWDLRRLPFPLAENDKELKDIITGFDENEYVSGLEKLFRDNNILEDGGSSKRVVDFIENIYKHE